MGKEVDQYVMWCHFSACRSTSGWINFTAHSYKERRFLMNTLGNCWSRPITTILVLGIFGLTLACQWGSPALPPSVSPSSVSLPSVELEAELSDVRYQPRGGSDTSVGQGEKRNVGKGDAVN